MKRDNVSYIVAPYEADAQLAYLCLKGHADAILTPDSDLIAYGCKKLEGSKAFTGFTQDIVLQTCILGGCDYVSIRGVSIKEAINAMRDHNGVMNEEDDYFKVIEKASVSKTENFKKYMDLIKNIKNTFQHQRVYNPDDKTIVHLTHMPSEREDDYLYGSPIAQEFAEGIATEDLDPGTIKKMKFHEQQGASSRRLSTTGFLRFLRLSSDFGLWKIKMRALLIQHGCEAALEVLPADMEAQTKVELNKKAHNAMILCLRNKVLRGVTVETTAVRVWTKLETLYMIKSLANKLYLKKKLYTFYMPVGQNISEHIDEFNKIILDLANIEKGKTDRRDSRQSRGKSRSNSRGGRLKCYICQSEDHLEETTVRKENSPQEVTRVTSKRGSQPNSMVRTYDDSDTMMVEINADVCKKGTSFAQVWHKRPKTYHEAGLQVLKSIGRLQEGLCIESGIARHLTVAGTPQQNGVAERMNRTLMSPSTAIEKKTPMEMWSGHPSDYGMLMDFLAVRISHTINKIVTSRNVVFNESVMYKDTLKDSVRGDKSVEEYRSGRWRVKKAGDQETDQTPDLIDYQLARDRERRTRTKPLSKAEIGSLPSLCSKRSFDMKGAREANKIHWYGDPSGSESRKNLRVVTIWDTMSKVSYANAVESLMYLMVCMRPDIAYAVLLIQTMLRIRIKVGLSLVTHFSTGCFVSWKEMLQHVVSLSTTEAEVYALHRRLKKLLAKGLLEDLGVKLTQWAFNCDNQGAIHLSQNHVFHERTKHINVRISTSSERSLEAKNVMLAMP
ncbi:retrovirus-related pol polyprotein from transposon TNT 1-94 [Tanacetum coccineum]